MGQLEPAEAWGPPARWILEAWEVVTGQPDALGYCRFLKTFRFAISRGADCTLEREEAPAGPGTGGAQGARILRGAAPEAGTPRQGPSSRHPPAVWRRARRGLRLLGTRHVPASRHASAPGTARVLGARRGALAAPLLRQTRGGWSSWGFGILLVCAVHGSCAQARVHGI